MAQRDPPPPIYEKDESEVRWLISYSDFMMQLVCLFILLYSVSTADAGKLGEITASYRAHIGMQEVPMAAPPMRGVEPSVGERSIVDANEAGTDLPRRLRYKIQVVKEGHRVEFEESVFDRGSAVLLPHVQAALEEIAASLHSILGTLYITGGVEDHAEEVRDGDALALAQARASSVTEFLTRSGFKHRFDPRHVVPAGVGVGTEPTGRRVTLFLKVR